MHRNNISIKRLLYGKSLNFQLQCDPTLPRPTKVKICGKVFCRKNYTENTMEKALFQKYEVFY